MRSRLLAATLFALVACGDDGPPGTPRPYDDIPATRTLSIPGLTAPVDIVRDRHGIPHIYAVTEADAYAANGYIVASDRWLQLDLLRHVANGRVAELFGALAPSQIDNDLIMRMHRFEARAAAQVAALRADPSPEAVATVVSLDRFAAGVNAYLDDLRTGKISIDPVQASFIAPEVIAPWRAEDSVVIGLLQAWSLSFDDFELDLTAYRQAGERGFAQSADPARQALARAFDDLFPLEQLDHASTIAGWPDGSTQARVAPRTAAAPMVPPDLLARARAVARPIDVFGMSFRQPEDGSNNWVVGPSLAGGAALVANDPHLQLSNPPVFHYVHLTVPDALDVAGISLSGVPGVVLGHTQTLAWGSTTSNHDVTDFFLEDIHPCPGGGGGECVTYQGAEVPLTSFTEEIKVGALGTITETFTAVYQVVPHHGPILPNIVDHRVTPRPPGPAISVKYTGHQPTRETLALARLNRATDVASGFAALDVFDHGSQNWVMADAAGRIGWTTSARMPIRSPGCRTWTPTTGAGTAPFFVLPGDGSCTWTGEVDPRFVPHAIDPASGYLATANADPIGETFDGDPLNGPHYAGFDYGPGFRQGRITRRLEALKASGRAMTVADMQSIQGDTYSNAGDRLRPFIVAAVDRLVAERTTPGTHPDLTALAGTLDAARVARLVAARDRLGAWTFATHPGGDSATAAERDDAVATTIFNFWQIEFYRAAFGDELGVLGAAPNRQYTISAAVNALEHPERLRTGTAPGFPTSARLCDSFATPAVETCTYQIVVALDAALEQGVTRLGADPATWDWGRLHVARAPALVPAAALDLPGTGRTYPRPGDSHAVDASNPAIGSYSFAYQHGPAMRTVMKVEAGKPIEQEWALPGGQIFDTRSPHFRDQMDEYWTKNRYVAVPFATPDIIVNAEDRWVAQP